LLKRRIYTILLETGAKPYEIRDRILVISVDGDPLAPLRGGVDGVKADGDFAFQVAADGVWRQAESLAGFLIGGTVVIMAATFWVRPVGLEGIGPPVDEEVEVGCHNSGGHFETKLPHSLLPEVWWTTLLFHVGGEMMRLLSRRALVLLLRHTFLEGTGRETLEEVAGDPEVSTGCDESGAEPFRRSAALTGKNPYNEKPRI
jgi:hypothetical protein